MWGRKELSPDFDKERLLSDLRRDEGTGPLKNGRFLPYKDSVNVLTVGYGRNLDKGLSPAEVDLLLVNDVEETIRAARNFSWFDGLDGVRKVAVLNMMFNLGPARFSKFHQTIYYLINRQYHEASVEMLSSLWAQQVGSRALRLAEMIRTGRWIE